MTKVKAMLVVGARPQFIKSAPVIREILSKHGKIELFLIHSGQHHDREMSEVFFHQLRIPTPLTNLQAGFGSHAKQTAMMMKRLEGAILEARPDVVVVPGDTNTTLAAALTAAKLAVPVAHLEAGLRSGDMTMPEEINRRLTDHCSSLLFAPTQTAANNLLREGLGGLEYLTGDTMVDALCIAEPFVRKEQEAVLGRLGLTRQAYVVVTLHRPSNVDDRDRLCQILLALRKIAKKLRVVFPVHPRTRLRLVELRALKELSNSGIVVTTPQGYVEIQSLVKNASCLLTDSGGMQKESFLLHVPCVTLRSTTEWPETLAGKANQLVVRPDKIAPTILKAASDDALRKRIRGLRNPFGDGHSARRIVRIVEKAPWPKSY